MNVIFFGAGRHGPDRAADDLLIRPGGFIDDGGGRIFVTAAGDQLGRGGLQQPGA